MCGTCAVIGNRNAVGVLLRFEDEHEEETPNDSETTSHEQIGYTLKPGRNMQRVRARLDTKNGATRSLSKRSVPKGQLGRVDCKGHRSVSTRTRLNTARHKLSCLIEVLQLRGKELNANELLALAEEVRDILADVIKAPGSVR